MSLPETKRSEVESCPINDQNSFLCFRYRRNLYIILMAFFLSCVCCAVCVLCVCVCVCDDIVLGNARFWNCAIIVYVSIDEKAGNSNPFHLMLILKLEAVLCSGQEREKKR